MDDSANDLRLHHLRSLLPSLKPPRPPIIFGGVVIVWGACHATRLSCILSACLMPSPVSTRPSKAATLSRAGPIWRGVFPRRNTVGVKGGERVVTVQAELRHTVFVPALLEEEA